MTRREALEAAASRLAADPLLRERARRDAELLLLVSLRIERAALLAHPDDRLRPEEADVFEQAIQRRLRHEPIQYITGEQEFYGLALRVTPAVLIPRPETEHLVEAVLKRMLRGRVVDVGTGSGAIAVALAVYAPGMSVAAIDLSPEALAVARENVRRHGVEGRVRLLQSDLLEAVADEHFEAVVSNPPYVPETDRASLHPEVREHEPGLALFAGADGMAVYRRLIPQAWNALEPGGLLALEIGAGQRETMAGLLAGWDEVEFVPDLQGIPRMALARRR